MELRIAVGDGELVCVVPSREGTADVGASVEVVIPREAVRLVPTQLGALGSGIPGGTGPTEEGVPSSQAVFMRVSPAPKPVVHPVGRAPAAVLSKFSVKTVTGGVGNSSTTKKRSGSPGRVNSRAFSGGVASMFSLPSKMGQSAGAAEEGSTTLRRL